MAGSIRCPNCGGLNPSGAEWCGQCLQRFATSTPPPPPPPPPTAGAPAAAPSPAPVVKQKRGAFTVSDEGITWQCTRCDAENPLDAPVCAVCGTTFADALRPPPERPVVDPNSVALYSLFFPGAGHWKLGMKGAAVARGLLSTWVVVVALLAGIGGSLVMGVIFGVASFALWGAAAHDAYREARNEPARVFLKSRVFVYVVLSLLLLMFVMLVSAGLQVNP